MAKVVYPLHIEGGPNAGEKRLIDYLKENLPDDYYIVPNGEYAMKSPQGMVNYWEYDCLVVAPHAIYHIENKDWGGNLIGDDFAWFINGVERKNPYPGATLKSKLIAGKLGSKNPDWRNARVFTLITLSNPAQSKFGLDPHCVCYDQVFLLNAILPEFIKDYEKAGKPKDCIAPYQKEIVQYLTGESSHRSMAKKTEILNYKILEVLQKTETFTEYLCQPKFFVDKRYKVREYPLDFPDKTKSELDTIRNRAANASYAQSKMNHCPYIITSQCQFNDEQTAFYEISEYLDECTLRARLRQKTFTQIEKIGIILNIASALSEAHSKQVFHRDVCPENIYILANGTAALANFGHSWFIEHTDMHFTVGSSLSKEDVSPYAPPEFKDEDVSAASDLYSFGVIIYELMTGKLPFESTLKFRLSGGVLTDDKLPSRIDSDLPEWLDEIVKHTIVADMDNRWNDINKVTAAIQQGIISSAASNGGVAVVDDHSEVEINLADLKPGDSVTPELILYEELGHGAFGRVFKAKHTLQNKFYAMKIFDRDVSASETINEFEALKDLSHNNIVKFTYNGRTKHGLFYTLMELLDGDNLRDYVTGSMRLPAKEVYNMANGILSALVYMQGKIPPVFHRDIKPNNIVWDGRSRFVLIDFNISTTTEDKTFSGTLPYMAPDLILSSQKIDWDCSADTFALGVTMYELLTQTYPWPGSDPCPKTGVSPTDIRKYNDKISDAFADFVMKSIVTDRNGRFLNAKEMLDALNAIGVNGISRCAGVNVNTISRRDDIDIVDYINSLYSQSKHGNSGTRAGSKGSELDKLTYTETRLDKELITDIEALKYKLIIITGNAGDGKTAFIRHIEDRGQYRQAFTNKNGSTFQLNRLQFQSNYDGSQDEEERANNDVLNEFFAPFFGLEDYTQASEGRIIAINEGRLMDFLNTQRELRALNNNIEDFFYNEGHTELLPGLMVINLNLRSVTAGDRQNPSLLSQQMKKLTNKELWTKCQGCPIADKCFIKYNVDTFQDSSAGDEVIERLEWLMRAIVYKRELHITMRDLRSFIAFMLTRDFSCDQVKKLVEYTRSEDIAEYYWLHYYFNITAPKTYPNVDYFPLPTNESSDRLIKMLRETDIAKVALPAFDRDLYYTDKKDENYLIFGDREQSLLAEFNERNQKLPGWEVNEKTAAIVSDRHQSFIRHQYFEGKFDYKRRLPYRFIDKFCELMKSNDQVRLAETKHGIAIAISASEGCDNAALTDGYLLLASNHVGDKISKSYRRFNLDEFELFVNKTDHLTKYIEYESDSFIFRHKKDTFIQLTVSLDLYEMLQYIKDGFTPSVNDLKGKFIELQIFKNLLESKTYNEILVTKNNKKFSIIRLDENKHIIIEPLNN